VVRRHPNSILDFPLPYPRVSHASAGSFIHCTTRSFDFHFSTFHSPLPTSHFPLPTSPRPILTGHIRVTSEEVPRWKNIE
jgi:hypothetical protein